MSSLVWHRSVRGVDVPPTGEDAVGRDVDAALDPAAGLADDVPATTPLVDPVDPVEPVEPVEPEAACAELVAAVTEPEKVHADSARTTSTAAGTGRTARRGEIVMPSTLERNGPPEVTAGMAISTPRCRIGHAVSVARTVVESVRPVVESVRRPAHRSLSLRPSRR